MKSSPMLVLVLTMLATARPAATEIAFTGDLDGPTVGSGSPATGEATLVLDDDQATVVFTITYGNLVGEEIAAHFHAAPPGSFGPIVFELPLGTPKNGVWEIPAQRLQSLLDGHVYVIIHSDAYPAGEIGGWVSATEVAIAGSRWTDVRNPFRKEAR